MVEKSAGDATTDIIKYAVTIKGQLLDISLIPTRQFKGYPAARAGGKDGGGGDPAAMVRSFLVESGRTFSDETLSATLLTYFGDDTNSFRVRMIAVLKLMSTELHKIRDEKIRGIVAQLIERGLLQDIASSPILFKNECFIIRDHKKITRAATAIMNRPNTPICLDPIALAKSMKGTADSMLLFGFVVHEYVHHFGYEDADYAIANELSLTLKDLILNARAERGHSLGDILFTIAVRTESSLQTPRYSGLRTCLKLKTCFED